MKLPPISHTFHANYAQCPLKAFEYNIAKTVPFEKSEAMEWGKAVHRAMELRINRGTPLPAEMPYEQFCTFPAGYKVSAELKLAMRADGTGCGFFDDDVVARGVVDVLIEGPPLTTTAAIADHKTGKKSRYVDETEIELHALLLKANKRNLVKVVGWYNWLKDGEVGKLYDLSDFARVWKHHAQVRAEMQEKLKFGRDAFEPKESKLCEWCNVLTCKFNPRRAR